MWFLIAVVIAVLIIVAVRSVGGKDDNRPWPHPGDSDEHRWV